MINSEFRAQTPTKAQEHFFIHEPVTDESGEEVFRAGQMVPAGTYVDIESFRQVFLEVPERLPGSLDGRRAYYRRYERPWAV